MEFGMIELWNDGIWNGGMLERWNFVMVEFGTA